MRKVLLKSGVFQKRRGSTTTTMVAAMVATLGLSSLSGCQTYLAAYHGLNAAIAVDVSDERAALIEAATKEVDQALADQNYIKAIDLTQTLWELGFANNCYGCQAITYFPLERVREAILSSSTTMPAFQVTVLLSYAVEKQKYASGWNNAEDDYAEFKEELKAALASVVERARPELMAKMESLESSGKTASAMVLSAQAVALYPEDADMKARSEALRQKVRSAHTMNISRGGGPIAASVPDFTTLAIAFVDVAPLELTVTSAERTTNVASNSETLSASVVRGKKSVPNRDYERLVDKIAHTEKLRSEDQEALAKGQSVASNQSDIQQRTRQIADMQKDLSRMSSTEEIDNVVSENYAGTRETRTVHRNIDITVKRGAEVVANKKDSAAGNASVLNHGGYGPAGISPAHSSTPSEDSVDARCIDNAISITQGVVMGVYADFVVAEAKAAGDDVEAAAIVAVLNLRGLDDASRLRLQSGLGVSDPRALLTSTPRS